MFLAASLIRIRGSNHSLRWIGRYVLARRCKAAITRRHSILLSSRARWAVNLQRLERSRVLAVERAV